mmetsp:Transcript_2686/g.8725  ORF Transcript_2686/g.8725 Transcript_2686/m.8725 type:complete len:183 (+) Transcript_2686:1424-1972(+)
MPKSTAAAASNDDSTALTPGIIPVRVISSPRARGARRMRLPCVTPRSANLALALARVAASPTARRTESPPTLRTTSARAAPSSPPPPPRASWTIDDDAVRVAVDRPRGAAVDDTDVDGAARGDAAGGGGRGVGGAARGRRGRVRVVDDDGRGDASWSSRYDARARGWVFGLRRRVGERVCQG